MLCLFAVQSTQLLTVARKQRQGFQEFFAAQKMELADRAYAEEQAGALKEEEAGGRSFHQQVKSNAIGCVCGTVCTGNGFDLAVWFARRDQMRVAVFAVQFVPGMGLISQCLRNESVWSLMV
eukprot:3291839-Rhodomonas_salina.1